LFRTALDDTPPNLASLPPPDAFAGYATRVTGPCCSVSTRYHFAMARFFSNHPTSTPSRHRECAHLLLLFRGTRNLSHRTDDPLTWSSGDIRHPDRSRGQRSESPAAAVQPPRSLALRERSLGCARVDVGVAAFMDCTYPGNLHEISSPFRAVPDLWIYVGQIGKSSLPRYGRQNRPRRSSDTGIPGRVVHGQHTRRSAPVPDRIRRGSLPTSPVPSCAEVEDHVHPTKVFCTLYVHDRVMSIRR
jgi:hypothetical protein